LGLIVLAIGSHDIGVFTDHDPRRLDCVADHVGRALLPSAL